MILREWSELNMRKIKKVDEEKFNDLFEQLLLIKSRHDSLIDLLELEVIDYLDVSTIEAFKEDFRGTLFESGANFLGTPKIINIDGGIYLDSNWEYLAYVDFENSSKSWVQALNDVDFCKFFGGDLLVGKKHSRPTVWDRYSGKVVWQSNNSVAANKVQIVGEYIVYSSYTGDVNAFRIDKEYKSPSRW